MTAVGAPGVYWTWAASGPKRSGFCNGAMTLRFSESRVRPTMTSSPPVGAVAT